jgi:hypothetical protein
MKTFMMNLNYYHGQQLKASYTNTRSHDFLITLEGKTCLIALARNNQHIAEHSNAITVLLCY